jgi:hypothetical protein
MVQMPRFDSWAVAVGIHVGHVSGIVQQPPFQAAAERAASSSKQLLRALHELRRVDSILEGCGWADGEPWGELLNNWRGIGCLGDDLRSLEMTRYACNMWNFTAIKASS